MQHDFVQAHSGDIGPPDRAQERTRLLGWSMQALAQFLADLALAELPAVLGCWVLVCMRLPLVVSHGRRLVAACRSIQVLRWLLTK